MIRLIKGIFKYVVVPAALLGTGYVIGYAHKNEYHQQTITQQYNPEFSKEGKTLDDIVRKIK